MTVTVMPLEWHATCDSKDCGRHVYLKAASAKAAVARLVFTYGWQGDAKRIVCKDCRDPNAGIGDAP